MENEIEKVISIDDQKEILNAIYACPHGALRMNPVVFENVENSCNLGRVEFINEKFLMETSQRSSRNSLKVDAANQVRCIFENIDAKVDFIGHYDGWVPDWNSKLLFLVESIHEELFKIPIKKKIVHAGVECAKIKSIYPEIDVIVIGTDIKNPGTLKEKVMVPGVSIFWKFIKEIINKIDSVSVL
jgi:dipeptidase D